MGKQGESLESWWRLVEMLMLWSHSPSSLVTLLNTSVAFHLHFHWLLICWNLNTSCPSNNFLMKFTGLLLLNLHSAESHAFLCLYAYSCISRANKSSLENSKFVSLMHGNLIGSSLLLAKMHSLISGTKNRLMYVQL